MSKDTPGKPVRNGKRTNLYLEPDLMLAAKRVAKARYGISLSELTERLYRRELSLKKGLVRTKTTFEPVA